MKQNSCSDVDKQFVEVQGYCSSVGYKGSEVLKAYSNSNLIPSAGVYVYQPTTVSSYTTQNGHDLTYRFCVDPTKTTKYEVFTASDATLNDIVNFTSDGDSLEIDSNH